MSADELAFPRALHDSRLAMAHVFDCMADRDFAGLDDALERLEQADHRTIAAMKEELAR